MWGTFLRMHVLRFRPAKMRLAVARSTTGRRVWPTPQVATRPAPGTDTAAAAGSVNTAHRLPNQHQPTHL